MPVVRLRNCTADTYDVPHANALGVKPGGHVEVTADKAPNVGPDVITTMHDGEPLLWPTFIWSLVHTAPPKSRSEK